MNQIAINFDAPRQRANRVMQRAADAADRLVHGKGKHSDDNYRLLDEAVRSE